MPNGHAQQRAIFQAVPYYEKRTLPPLIVLLVILLIFNAAGPPIGFACFLLSESIIWIFGQESTLTSYNLGHSVFEFVIKFFIISYAIGFIPCTVIGLSAFFWFESKNRVGISLPVVLITGAATAFTGILYLAAYASGLVTPGSATAWMVAHLGAAFRGWTVATAAIKAPDRFAMLLPSRN